MALVNDLRFFGTTLNDPPDYRTLMRQAATEIERLESLHAPIRCFNCERVIERAAEWYRCFDCKSSLCEMCVTKHFGEPYTPHHRRMEEYERTIERLERKIKTLSEKSI